VITQTRGAATRPLPRLSQRRHDAGKLQSAQGMTLVVPGTFFTPRPRFDFHQWILELDEPSRARFERFIEFAADATALGNGGTGAEG
jgi:hypothetical protein